MKSAAAWGLACVLSAASNTTAATRCETVGGQTFTTTRAAQGKFTLIAPACGRASEPTPTGQAADIDAAPTDPAGGIEPAPELNAPSGKPALLLRLYDLQQERLDAALAVAPAAMADSSTAAMAHDLMRPVPLLRPLASQRTLLYPAKLRMLDAVGEVAQSHQIDPLFLHAIIHVESRFNPLAVSHAGARGLMQVIPATARRFGVSEPRTELHDPRTNLKTGAAYLKFLQGMFGNDLTLVLAAYNAGEGAVARYGRSVPPYKETQAYVRDVLQRYQALRAVAQQ